MQQIISYRQRQRRILNSYNVCMYNTTNTVLLRRTSEAHIEIMKDATNPEEAGVSHPANWCAAKAAV